MQDEPTSSYDKKAMKNAEGVEGVQESGRGQHFRKDRGRKMLLFISSQLFLRRR